MRSYKSSAKRSHIFSDTLTENNEESECLLCDISLNHQVTPFVELFAGSRKTSDQIVARASSTFVCVDSAPIIPGHCMVVTERHIPSFANASSMEQEETLSFMRRIQSKLSSIGDICFFEHSPSADLTITAGCGINHAHLHALPISGRKFDLLLREHEFHTIEDLTMISQAVGDEAYLYVQTLDLGSAVARVHDVSNQSIRRALAFSIGNDNVANWQDQLFFAEKFGTHKAVEKSLVLLSGLETALSSVAHYQDVS